MDPTVAVAVTALLLVGALAGAMFWEAYRCRRPAAPGPRPEPPQEQPAEPSPDTNPIKDLQQQLQLLQERVAVSNALIQSNLGDISHRQEELYHSSNQLLNALSNSQVRGHWGELQLRRVVEVAGMLEHVDFSTQVQLDGGRLRPDMVIRLSGGRQVAVDSKTPMEAYLTATNAETERDRQEFLAEFLRAVKRHITVLAGKAYWQELEVSPEFVIMFLPSEAVFATALELDPALFEAAASKRVILATPSTLLAMLYTIGFEWMQVRQQESTREAVSLVLEMYDRLCDMTNNLVQVGSSLEEASKAYGTAMFHLERRVLVSGRKLQQLSGRSKALAQVAEGDSDVSF